MSEADERLFYDDELYKAGWSDPAVPVDQQKARAERAEATALRLEAELAAARATIEDFEAYLPPIQLAHFKEWRKRRRAGGGQ